MRINDFTISLEKHSPTTLAEIYSNVTILRSDSGVKIIAHIVMFCIVMIANTSKLYSMQFLATL